MEFFALGGDAGLDELELGTIIAGVVMVIFFVGSAILSPWQSKRGGNEGSGQADGPSAASRNNEEPGAEGASAESIETTDTR